MKHKKQFINLFFISHALLTLHDQICINLFSRFLTMGRIRTNTLPYNLMQRNDLTGNKKLLQKTPDRLRLVIYALVMGKLKGMTSNCFSIFQLTTKFCWRGGIRTLKKPYPKYGASAIPPLANVASLSYPSSEPVPRCAYLVCGCIGLEPMLHLVQ